MNAYTVGLLSGHVSIAGGEFYKTGKHPEWLPVKEVSSFDPKHDQPQLHAAVSLPASSTIHHFFENCGMVPFYQYNVCFLCFSAAILLIISIRLHRRSCYAAKQEGIQCVQIHSTKEIEN